MAAMKRAYKTVEAVSIDGGWEIRLDGKPVRSPAGRPLLLPTAGLAQAIAEEWAMQAERVDPTSMPLMRLAATACDRIPAHRNGVIDELMRFAASDLVCYRATGPAPLVQRQVRIWQPLVDWVAVTYDAPLTVTSGLMPCAQPSSTLAALRHALAALDAAELGALGALTGALGSLVIALALKDGRIDADAAFEASQLDETFQIEQWGEDAVATARRAALREDIASTGRYLGLLRGR